MVVVEDELAAVAVVGETEDDLSLDLVDDQSIRVKEEEVDEDRSSTGGGGWGVWVLVVFDPLLPRLLEDPFEAAVVAVLKLCFFSCKSLSVEGYRVPLVPPPPLDLVTSVSE